YFWGGAWNEEPRNLDRAVMPDDGPSPLEIARRFYYDSMVFDHRAIRYLVDLLGADRLLVGSDFPAMLREDPVARTLRSMELPDDAWQDISWRNALRWLGRDVRSLPSDGSAIDRSPGLDETSGGIGSGSMTTADATGVAAP